MTTETVCRVLNEALAADPVAMDAIIRMRVSCNKAMAEHATLQVLACEASRMFLLGALGLINGITLTEGKVIKAVYDPATGRVANFVVVRG